MVILWGLLEKFITLCKRKYFHSYAVKNPANVFYLWLICGEWSDFRGEWSVLGQWQIRATISCDLRYEAP